MGGVEGAERTGQRTLTGMGLAGAAVCGRTGGASAAAAVGVGVRVGRPAAVRATGISAGVAAAAAATLAASALATATLATATLATGVLGQSDATDIAGAGGVH